MLVKSPGIGYRLLSCFLYPFWILHGFRHGAKHTLGVYLSMRVFGSKQNTADDYVWVHASSVGEVRAVSPLVQTLLERNEKILFTSFTATGYKMIQQLFADAVASGVIPIDFYWSCRSFLKRHRIKLGLIMETELWPELLFQAQRRGVPLFLINARLSRKSLETNRFVRRLLGNTLHYFSRILTRHQKDQAAFTLLGVDPSKILVVGNLKLKFDQRRVPERLVERDYILLASSHADEEQRFLNARPDQLKSHLLVLAPRHPQRSASIQSQIEAMGISYAVRSMNQPINAATEVYLADTLGELNSLFAFARLVVMGGSFDHTGGHNLIEPASLGCAIITGPSDNNISEDIALLGQNKGVLQVPDIAACWQAIENLVADPTRARAMGQEAQTRLSSQPDIVQQYLAVIDKN